MVLKLGGAPPSLRGVGDHTRERFERGALEITHLKLGERERFERGALEITHLKLVKVAM